MSLKVGVSVEIRKAKRLDGYRLKLMFSDGHVSVVDFEPFLRSSLNPETQRFLDAKRFRKFALLHGNLVWGDYEMCFPVEDLYEGTLGAYQSETKALAVAEPQAQYGKRAGRRRG